MWNEIFLHEVFTNQRPSATLDPVQACRNSNNTSSIASKMFQELFLGQNNWRADKKKTKNVAPELNKSNFSISIFELQ